MSDFKRNLTRAGLAMSLASVIALTGCSTPKPVEIVNAETASTVLVVPTINKTTQVNADRLFNSLISMPFAERGYYVYGPETTRMIFEADGLYEPEKVQETPADQLAQLFGSDVVVKVQIHFFDTSYYLLKTRSEIRLTYQVYDKGGNLLLNFQDDVFLDQGGDASSLGGLIASAITSAINRAVNNMMPVTDLAAKRMIRGFGPGPHAIKKAVEQTQKTF